MAHFVIDYLPTISIKVLSQCAGAGIDLYANWVIMVLSRNFNLSVQGQRNINAALTNLPVHFSSDETLAFGWTLEHALRNRGVHVDSGGYEHLAMEGALTEAFSEVYAAKVLHEMATAYAEQSDVTPHIRQWRDLVRSSNGIFASTDFGLLVEDYVRLNPYSSSTPESLEGSRHLPRPKSVSLALGLLAQITTQREKQMTISGGPIIGWFGAAAEWLFGLRIAICSSTGESLYGNHENHTQVLLVYLDKSGLYAQIESWNQDSVRAKEVATRSNVDAESTLRGQLGGRVVWNSLLSRVFGASFHHLDREENKTIGAVIGSAARVFQGLAEDNPSGYTGASNPATYGTALIRNLPDWLPELRRPQARMERQLKLSFEEARKVYLEQMQILQGICKCSICTEGLVTTSGSHIRRPPGEYCLSILVETIIALALTLSNTAVVSKLYPKRSGLQGFYSKQVARRVETKKIDVSDIRHFETVYANVWDAPDATRLQNCAEIFSGSRPTTELPENIVALAHGGICAYLVKLEKPERSTRAENEGQIRVISGGVCVRHKVFRRACLGPVADADELENVWEQVNCEHLSQPLYCK